MSHKNKAVLVVDDEPLNVKMIKAHLEPKGYSVLEATDGHEALKQAEKKPDLILLDIMMPGISGFETCKRLKANRDTQDIPVIFLSALQDPKTKASGLEMGGVDYLTKPFDFLELSARVNKHLSAGRRERRIKNYAKKLEFVVEERTRQLSDTRRTARQEIRLTMGKLKKALEGTIQAMAMIVERRDPYTAGHQRRVADLAAAIAGEMNLSKDLIDGIRTAGCIHDIGKIALPGEILSKPGRLTDTEFRLIKDHPRAGYDILKEIEFPWPVAEIVFQHHEQYDGSGYPSGLSGHEILLEARILAVADVVEAMSSHRPYRPALGIAKALEEISRNKGILYDPEVVEVCLKGYSSQAWEFGKTEKASVTKFYLILQSESMESRFFPLTGPVKIGRGQENDICLPDVKASRVHALVQPQGEEASLEDLGSRNGTFVNGEPVVEKVILNHGDMITIGDMCIPFHVEEREEHDPSSIVDTEGNDKQDVQMASMGPQLSASEIET